MKATELKIELIVKKLKLLKIANNADGAFVSELSKELGVKKTELTEFILDYGKLFVVCNKDKGLFIKNAYDDVKQNPYSVEYLECKKETWKNTLFIQQWDCYGQKEEYFISEDRKPIVIPKSYIGQHWLWRNTAEKMKRFIDSGHYHKGTGSTGMYSGTSIPYCLSISEMEALVKEGWYLKGEVPEQIIGLQTEEE